MTGPLAAERRDGVLLLTLDRPERRNALSVELVDALLAALEGAAADPGVRAIVLTGRAPGFCAGGDLGGGLRADGPLAQHHERARFGALLLGLHRSPLPVVAAVNGPALGGGCGLALACHLVVAEPSAVFGCPELGVGLFPMMIAPVLLRALPRPVAMDLLLGLRRLEAAEAQALGAVSRLAPDGGAQALALELAATLAGRSRAVLGLGLGAVAAVSDQPLAAAIPHMAGQLSLNLQSEDAAEGISAFLARRAPIWKDR